MRKIGLFLTAGAVLAAAPALADGQLVSKLTAPPVDHHTWYVTLGGGLDVQNLESWDILFDSTNGSGNPIGYEETVLGGGYQATLGHVFGKQLDPQIWGGRLHVSASGYYFHGDAEGSGGTPDGINVNMLNFGGGVFVTIDPLGVEFATQIRTYGAELRAGIDFPAGEGLMLTPSIALFGGETDLEQRAFIEEDVESGLPNFFDRIFQNLETDRIGGAAGLGAALDLGGGFRLTGGAQIGLVYASTNGNIDQCAGSSISVRFCNGGFFDQTFETEEDTLGFVAGGGIGVDYDLEFAVVGLAAQVGYDSTTPIFDYPDVPGELPGIDYVGSWSYGGGLTVTVPLN